MEAEEDRDHHHTDSQTGAAQHHRWSVAHVLGTEGRDESADAEEYDDAAGHYCCDFGIDADGFDEDGWYLRNDLC